MAIRNGAALVAAGILAWSGGASAASPPPPLDAYGNLPAVERVTQSPDGESFAAIAMVAGQRRLLILDSAGKPHAAMPLGDAKVRDISWCTPVHVCLTSSRTEKLGFDFTTDKFEAYFTAVIGMDSAVPPRFVFANRKQIAPIVYGPYGFRTVGTRHFGYFGGVEMEAIGFRNEYQFVGGRPGLYEVDLDTMAVRKLAPPADSGHEQDWLIDAGGRIAARFDLNHASGKWIVANAKGDVIAGGTDQSGQVGLVAFGASGQSVIWSKRGEDGDGHWYETPLAGGESHEVLAGVDVERIYVDPGSGRMIGHMSRSGADAGKPVLADPEAQKRLRAVYRAFPGLRVGIADFTPDIGKVLARISGNGNPGTWMRVDLAAHKAEPIGDERPAIASEQVGPISTIAYTAADGMALDGILTLPPGRAAKNLPVVMLPHGGPHAHDRAEFDWWAQALASRGYAVFQPNFRGSTNRDAAFRDAGDGEWGRKMQTDISDGLAELAKQGIVDPKRACIAGASYGGYAALAGVTLQKGLYRCAVAVAPVSDIGEMVTTDIEESADDALVRRSRKAELGPSSGYAAISPRRHAAAADAPVLIVHGKDDTVVPFRQGSQMADALKDAHKPVELVVMEKEDHWLSRAETRKQMLAATTGFILKHNPPD